MKNIIKDFCLRGLIAMGFGPIVVAIIYAILGANGVVTELTVNEMVLSVISSAVMAFLIGGVNVIYQVERLPLMFAILIHGLVLYIIYISVYLINGWLQSQILPVIIFSVIFVVGYAVIWACIYMITRRKTNAINHKLRTLE